MLRLIAPMVFAVAGCGYAPVDVLTGWDIDSDGDGLSDAAESESGTDPSTSDSDGDNWSDGDEVEQGTDPLDADSHPYTGGWSIDAACRDDLSATGNSVGDITDDFALSDQFGDTVSLYDFCGHAVLLVSGAFW